MKFVPPALIPLLLHIPLIAYTQALDISRFFRTGLNIRAEYIPNADLQDTTGSVSFTRYNAQLIMPLKGRIKASWRELDITAKQYFLTLNGGVRQIRNSKNTPFEPYHNLYTASFAVAGLRAGLRSKMWLYAFGGGITESISTFNNLHPYATVAALRVKIKGLNHQKFYGLAAVYSNSTIPFIIAPIWGINKKIFSKTTLTLILPVQAQLTYKFDRKNNLALLLTPGGYNGGVQDTNLTKNKIRLQYIYSHFKSAACWNWKPNSNVRLTLEAGLLWGRNIVLSYLPDRSKKDAIETRLKPSPVFSLNVYASLTNKFLDSSDFAFEF
ncbi:MAG: DUF6268 family outer membrane beta-barrel protein [Bacteroidia bacterium]|nr:DUF6268 family outer membrane beta-barrel protein [Bacteroidia bacterium]MDW8347311.1 DUF6268 family outer membrane beta-barrel protein [Bacteroidia bacterium]